MCTANMTEINVIVKLNIFKSKQSDLESHHKFSFIIDALQPRQFQVFESEIHQTAY